MPASSLRPCSPVFRASPVPWPGCKPRLASPLSLSPCSSRPGDSRFPEKALFCHPAHIHAIPASEDAFPFIPGLALSSLGDLLSRLFPDLQQGAIFPTTPHSSGHYSQSGRNWIPTQCQRLGRPWVLLQDSRGPPWPTTRPAVTWQRPG